VAPTSMNGPAHGAPRVGFRALEAVALGAAALVAIALGWVVANNDGFGPDMGSAALLTLGALASFGLIMAGPVPCLAGIAVASVAFYGQPLGQVGTLSVAPGDVLYAGLVGWWLLRTLGRAQGDFPDDRPRIAFGQSMAILFFAYTALTFWNVALSDPGALGDSVVSWLRLIQTASIAFLAASVIETKQDVRLVLGAVVIAGILAIILAVSAGGNVLSGRATAGSLGPQSIGMLSGLILLIGAFGAASVNVRHRIALAAVGLFGLLIAKSVASFVAVGFALALGAAFMAAASSAQRVTRVALTVGLAGVLVFGAVQLFRPEVTPGSEEFKDSSAARRILTIAAGFEIFERNPVIGAGWRQSSNPGVIGDRDVVTDVRRRFPEARPAYYTDVTPTFVHNAYVQVLADLGLVGFLLFVAVIVAIAVRVRDLLRRLGSDHELRREAWVMGLGLLLLLVWFNDKPMFGGQPETVVAALLIGTLAATSRIVAEAAPATGGGWSHPPGRGSGAADGPRMEPS
jgi:O-antigen ligase